MNIHPRYNSAPHAPTAVEAGGSPLPFLDAAGKALSLALRHLSACRVAIAMLLFCAHHAGAQNIPYPPTVIIGQYVLTGSGGSYSTNNYEANGNTGSAMVSIAGTGVHFGAGTGYMQPGPLLSSGFWVEGHYTGGYWIPGAVIGHYDENNNFIYEYTEPDVWVPTDWVDGYQTPDVYGPDTWVSTGSWEDVGVYSNFSFHDMLNSTSILPADANGNAWATNPQFGIPAVLVEGVKYPFAAADTAAGYDYFSEPGGDGYFWINATACGGYHAQIGSFEGRNRNGFFQSATPDPDGAGTRIGDPVNVYPRNGDGTFLAIGSPAFGPERIWSDGLTFRFLTRDTIGGLDVYLEDTNGHVFVHSPQNNTPVVSGKVTGTYVANVFTVDPGTPPAFAATADGAPLPAGSAPQWGHPPAIVIPIDLENLPWTVDSSNLLWKYRGSTATADYYGGVRPGQILTIGANGAVSYTDRTINFYNVSGFYNGGVFQNLPVVVRGVNANGTPWSSWPAGASYPPAITVNGQPWYYSSTASSSYGSPAYLGPQSGQVLTISGSVATIYDPTTSTYLTGTYGDGKFTFAGTTLTIAAAAADGTSLEAVPGHPGNIAGNLDVSGNSFTLGSWFDGIAPVNSFALTFEENPRLLRFVAVSPDTDWLWMTTTTAEGSAERMRIAADGKVVIGTAGSGEKLHVKGSVKVDGVIRVPEAGDISMGQFTATAP